MRFQDIRYALRGLRRSPGFTLTAILTLALGIGANTAIFSVLNAVLLRPLPFHDPARLVWGWGKTQGAESAGIGAPAYRDYRDQNRTFDQLAAIDIYTINAALTGEGQPEQVKEGIVSANFFDALGLKASAGRSFVPADENADQPQVVLLTRSLWRRRYSGSEAVVGKTLTIDGRSLTVAGVVPDVPLLLKVEMFVAMPMLNADMNRRQSHFLHLVGRIKPDTTFAQAQAELDAIAGRLGTQYPDTDRGWSVRFQPLSDVLIGPVRDALLILLSAVGLVLLIACANVANLLLVRATGRSREVAIRAALGASRGRLIRQFLTESLVLALAGGAAAVALASWGVDVVRRAGPADLPRLDEISVDGTVLAFAVLVSIVTGLLFGLAPALHATRDRVQATLKGSSRGTGGGVLVAAELAISLVLLISAGLSLKSLWKLIHVDPGFRTENVVTAPVRLLRNGALVSQQISDRIGALPDVAATGAVSELPMMGVENDDLFRIEGKIYPARIGPGSSDYCVFHSILGDYFQAMGTPLRSGRLFGAEDGASGAPVAIVNEPFARRLFPGRNPIGQHVTFDRPGGPVTREIVGVVAGARFFSLATPPFPELYVPYAQEGGRTMNFVMRTRGDASQIGSELRATIAAVDPGQPPPTVRTLNAIVSATAAQPRFYGFLLGSFAAVAALLAAIGLYGVIAYAVGRRTREIGIRMALGATSTDIARLIAEHGLRPIALGLAAGLIGAYFASRLLAARLYQVTPHDAATFVLVPLALAAIAVAACWAPLRRAMRVDPATSLRQD